MVCGGREKSTLFLIHKVADHVLRELCRGVEVRFIGPGFVEIHQSLCEVRRVFKIGIEVRTITPRCTQIAIRFGVTAEQKVGGPLSALEIGGVPEDPGSLGHRRQHHPVPRGDHLVIQAWRDAMSACVVQLVLRTRCGLHQLVRCQIEFPGHVSRGAAADSECSSVPNSPTP